MVDENNPNPPASQPVEEDEKITITSEEQYEKAMAKASGSENPAFYKSKVDAAYAEYQAKEAEKAEKEAGGEKTTAGGGTAGLTGSQMGIGPGTGVGASGTPPADTPKTGTHKHK
jgi:hypothetical protein